MFQASRRAEGSKPVVGSSRKSSSGLPMIPTPTSSLRCWPPESEPTRVLHELTSAALAAGEELDRRARLVVLNRGGVPVGLLTEGVEGTQLLDPERVEAALAHLPGTAAELLLGQVTDADGPCGVLDLDAVYRLSESLPRARRAG